ncbi:MAG: hypothetical protein ACI9MR_002287 [Myxococcota bacterium]|jgi:hypothetical protein
MTPESAGGAFRDAVNSQIALLRAGQPLEAFDRFFAPTGVMLANGAVFASDAAQARQKQEPFMTAAASIAGSIVDLACSDATETCVFRNTSSFTTTDGATHKIDGLCWQRWENARIVEERYFDGEQMRSLVANGILLKPEMLLDQPA